MDSPQPSPQTQTGDIDFDRFIDSIPSKDAIIARLEAIDEQKKILNKLLRLASSTKRNFALPPRAGEVKSCK